MQHLKLTPFPAPRRHPSQRLCHQRGMTLVEWMVSITIGLILLTGLSALIARQSSIQAELEKSSRQIENGRYAMQLLQDDIQLAGYYGEYSGAATLPLPTSLPNPCAVTAALLSGALPFHVQGFDAPASIPTEFVGCPASFNAVNRVSGTDILVVRRVDPETVPGVLVPGQVYLQSGLTASGLEFSYVLAVAAATSVDTTVFNLKKKDGTSTAPLRKYHVEIYFVSPCSKPNGTNCSADNTDDGGVSVPTLKRLELTAPGGAGTVPTFTTTPLVEGIENMQIDYGFDTTGDGAPDSYAKDAAPEADWATNPTHWGNVMAVRLHLLARSNERSAGHKDTKTYNLGLDGTTAATNDNFKRRVFSQLVRVVNPSSRRDQ
ncbi:MAG: PilW family protein [Polaromonas sp.]|nr:PilW family protein [Polaromonas sp.]